MNIDRPHGDDINVRIGGSVEKGAQFAAGRNINQSYWRASTGSQAPVTDADLAEFRRAIDEVRSRVCKEVSPEKQGAALDRVDEIEDAVTSGEPDATTMTYVWRWFTRNIPKLTGAIVGLIVHPVVGKVVEAAGDLAAQQLREQLGANPRD